MAYRPDFSGSWAKLTRAKVHRDALQGELEPMKLLKGEVDEIGIRAEVESSTGEYVMRVTMIPEEWIESLALELGECLYNLRSSLDHLMWQLALEYSDGKEPKGADSIYFPIERRLAKFNNRIKCIDPRYRGMLTPFQPYNRRTEGRRLALLKKMNDREKHRLLVPILLSPNRLAVTFADGSTMQFYSGAPGKRLKVGTEVTRSWSSGKPKLNVDGQLSPFVTLPYRRHPIHTLDAISATVLQVLRKFDPLPYSLTLFLRGRHLAHPPRVPISLSRE